MRNVAGVVGLMCRLLLSVDENNGNGRNHG